jgi:hypothetical protein
VAGIRYYNDLYGVRAVINVYEPKVKKNSNDLSQTGIEINNGPKGLVDSIVACYSVSPSSYGDSFARFHVVWVIHYVSSDTLCYQVFKYHNVRLKHNLI